MRIRIEPGVFEETFVLNGDQGVDQMLRQFRVRDRTALLSFGVEEIGDELRLQPIVIRHAIRGPREDPLATRSPAICTTAVWG